MQIHFDEAQIFDLLNGTDGPVWQLVNELSETAANVARATVPIRKAGSTWSAKSNARAIGYTLDSIRAVMGYDKEGFLYGGVNSAEQPTIWLEYPRVDRRRQPFLTTAVWDLTAVLA